MSENKEGIKIRTRAVLLCKNRNFWKYLNESHFNEVKSEASAKEALCDLCQIESRSELATNLYAQELMLELNSEYSAWAKLDGRYADNLNREFE